MSDAEIAAVEAAEMTPDPEISPTVRRRQWYRLRSWGWIFRYACLSSPAVIAGLVPATQGGTPRALGPWSPGRARGRRRRGSDRRGPDCRPLTLAPCPIPTLLTKWALSGQRDHRRPIIRTADIHARHHPPPPSLPALCRQPRAARPELAAPGSPGRARGRPRRGWEPPALKDRRGAAAPVRTPAPMRHDASDRDRTTPAAPMPYMSPSQTIAFK